MGWGDGGGYCNSCLWRVYVTKDFCLLLISLCSSVSFSGFPSHVVIHLKLLPEMCWCHNTLSWQLFIYSIDYHNSFFFNVFVKITIFLCQIVLLFINQ